MVRRGAIRQPCEVADRPLTDLFRFSDAANADLEREDRRLILAFDEFEQFDVKIGDGVFNLDLLSTIRESVQMHRRLIWVFAGSHHITELKHAPWNSYFVSLRTIEVPPFSAAETRLLLTEPLKESPLYERGARRPRFDAAFWGDGGIEWIHEQTAGWPHLVQLLAGTAVDLVNDANVAALDRALLQKAAAALDRRRRHGAPAADARRVRAAGRVGVSGRLPQAGRAAAPGRRGDLPVAPPPPTDRRGRRHVAAARAADAALAAA